MKKERGMVDYRASKQAKQKCFRNKYKDIEMELPGLSVGQKNERLQCSY